MILIIILGFVVSPLYDTNFTPLPIRSTSVFSNPAGLGVEPGVEAFLTYQPESKTITGGVSAENLGFGLIRMDTVRIYEIGLGYRLPGVFSLGYAHQFGDTSSHVLGVQARLLQRWALGYTITLGSKKYMFGGVALKPYQDYLILNFEVEYEGIDSIFTYYYGVRVQPYKGIGVSFLADEDFDWNVGVDLSFGYVKIAGLYSSADEKFSGGLVISAQKYQTFLHQRVVGNTKSRSYIY